MHIQENVIQTLKVEGTTGAGALLKADAEKGICVVQRDALSTEPNTAAASKSTAANQIILGTLGPNEEIAKIKGLLVFQCVDAIVAADIGHGIITTATAGKVDHHATAGSGFGSIIGGGDDPQIGQYALVLV